MGIHSCCVLELEICLALEKADVWAIYIVLWFLASLSLLVFFHTCQLFAGEESCLTTYPTGLEGAIDVDAGAILDLASAGAVVGEFAIVLAQSRSLFMGFQRQVGAGN